MADLPPNPGHFRGQPARRWIDALVDWLTRDRIIVSPGSGLRITDTPAGRLLEGGGGGGGAVDIYYTDGVISARSGATLGNGSATLLYLDGDVLTSTGTSRTVYNYTGGTIAAGKYCAVAYTGAKPVIISAEC